MASFTYTARDKKGLVSKGTVYAGDRQSAAASLIDKGLTPILVKEESATKAAFDPSNLFGSRREKVKLQDKVVFSRQLATMINAGVPITQSMDILKEQSTSRTLKKVLTDLSRKVQAGGTLSSAMADHPTVFTPVFVNMVRAGETGGILDQVLERLATQQERDADIVHKVRGAMIYPAVITSVTLIAFFFMMTVIVPRLAGVFASFGANLPAYTKFLLAVSKFMTHDWYILIGGTVALIIAFLRWIKTPSGRFLFDQFKLRVPVFGAINQKMNVARFARTFGSLMASGISVLDALNTTASTLNNTVYKRSLVKIAAEVKNGKSIHEPLRQSKIFPPIVSQMVLVGEETGQLDVILGKIAEFYEKEVENIISNITSIIEPILIIVIGGLVGSIVIGILGPIGSLSSQI